MTDEAAWITEFATLLDLPGLIDIHTHFMPERVMAKVWEYFDSAGPLTGREWPIQYRSDEQSRLDTLRGFGVRAFTSLVYPHKPDMAAWLNEWAAEFAAQTPDCLHTGTFYPEPHAASYVEAAIERGTRVFKSHVQVGDYHPNDPLLHGVWELLEDNAIPTVIHCGSAPAPGTFTGPESMRDVLVRYPRLPLIVAHMGMPDYSSFLDLVEEFPGVHLDTTLAFTDFSEEKAPFPVHELPRLQALGDRILWGSDFPNIPFTYAEGLVALTRLNLGDDWLRDVCYRNAARLFAIE